MPSINQNFNHLVAGPVKDPGQTYTLVTLVNNHQLSFRIFRKLQVSERYYNVYKQRNMLSYFNINLKAREKIKNLLPASIRPVMGWRRLEDGWILLMLVRAATT
jgi:hypothetical protein